MLLIIGVVLIAIGFILMTGGGSENPEVFNPDIFSFRRITLAPILVLAGFVVEIFAIMIKPKED
jgi:membrane-bound ClpP family serine protease